MRRWRGIVVIAALIGGVAVFWIASEIRYARSISPAGIATVHDFFIRFGEPQFIRMVERDGTAFYEFNGPMPTLRWAALPSSPPAYVFDEQGQFVAWHRDPGDDRRHRETWPLQSTDQVEIGTVKERFGL